MIEQRLLQQLEKVARRFRKLRFWQSLSIAWLAAAGVGACAFAANWAPDWRPSRAAALVAGFGLLAVIGCLTLALASARDYHWVAKRVEAGYPDLRSCLLTAIEQRPELPQERFGFLQDRVIRQALHHAYQHAWQRIVPPRRIAAAVLANAATLGLLIAVLAGLSLQGSARAKASAATSGAGGPADGRLSIVVEPGDTEVERGASLLVLARYQGTQPADATLVYSAASDSASSDESNRLAMSKSLDDPVFGGRISAVEAPLDYHVELADRKTETFHVAVFEYPKLVRADAKLVYPAYAALEERLIQDVRTISAPEGTELTLICRLNKPVASATLTEKEGEPLALAATEGEPRVYQATFRCDRSRRFALQLVDDRGRRNKIPADFAVNLLPNRPPDLKLVFPGRDVEVSPLEEADVAATARDDFGLKRYGVSYALAGAEPTEIVLGENAAANERHALAHAIRLEALKAEPDQLLSYYFWAEDLGSGGELRRAESDMYFAEVRPFEEIFRQGEQPPGGESQQQQQQGGANAQAAEKLGELQKQIIAATWKLIRRETAKAPSDAFADDARLVGESQASAWEQAGKLSEKLQDPESRKHAATVVLAMAGALEHLTAAQEGPALAPLSPALAAEQAAYQALLKLRAREHRVIRGRQQRGASGGGASNRSQQQLQQLELSNDENRYETQRTAQSPQQQQDRETLQVLNRLSELARRQSDLNERLKELQSALEQARSEEEREEVRRQLKRLREEEQEILRDSDELKSRMQSPENQERMADAGRQLDQTREQVRRASEALEQEQVSQAAAAGTRAEREFQELRNDFRRRSSGRFSEEMREMREEARKLDEDEQQLAQRLATPEQEQEASRSLRGTGEEQDLPGEIGQQKGRLEDLQRRMQDTIREAEQVEPLLAEQLYDTARKVQQQNPSRALEAAELSMRRGLADDAREQEQIARGGIGELRAGVERAAESVLGDETEALRRAEQELEQLSQELDEEIARNSGPPRPGQAPSDSRRRGGARPAEPSEQQGAAPGGQRPTEEQPNAPQPGRGQGDEREPGERRPGERQPGQEQQREGQGGQGQPGERQPGGGQPGQEQPGQEQPGEGQQGEGQPGERQPGQGQPNGGQPNQGQPGGGRNGRAGPRNLAGPGGTGGAFDPLGEALNRATAPITGEGFRDWSDRLRDVEEMVDNPELQAEAARIRDRARGIRAELKRHSKPPDWDLVRAGVFEPLVELRDRIAEELLRRANKDAIMPLDRDPVPPKYSEKIRRYYERLGTGQ